MRRVYDPAWPIGKSHPSWAVRGQVTPAEPTETFRSLLDSAGRKRFLLPTRIKNSKGSVSADLLVFPITYADNLLEDEVNTERKVEQKRKRKTEP